MILLVTTMFQVQVTVQVIVEVSVSVDGAEHKDKMSVCSCNSILKLFPTFKMLQQLMKMFYTILISN